MPTKVLFNIVVEGEPDERVARRLLESCGAGINASYGKLGKPYIDAKIASFAKAAEHAPWFVLRDLDNDGCPVEVSRLLVPHPKRLFCLRLAVRSVESWLIADSEEIANALAIRAGLVPRDPEDLRDPKRAIVDLARQSRRREIRQMLVPRDGSGRTVGAEYNLFLAEFIERCWRIDVAERRAPSLARARRHLERVVAAHRSHST